MNLHLPLLLERGPIQDMLLIFVFEVGIVFLLEDHRP